jgi:large subunit ribosomal protein L35
VPRKAKAGKIKLKTHKATSKRFRMTGGGKVVRTKGGKSHLRRNRSRRTRALLAEMQTVEGRSYIKNVKRLVPNIKK